MHILPLMAMRGIVVFPYMIAHFDVGRQKSVCALEAAMAADQMIFLVAQKDVTVEEPSRDDFYDIGTLAKIKQIIKLPGESVRVLIEGVSRAEICGLVDEAPYFIAEIQCLPTHGTDSHAEQSALSRQLKDAFEQYFSFDSKINSESMMSIVAIDDAAELADVIASNINLRYQSKQEVLESADVYDRVTRLIALLRDEIEIIRIEQVISNKVKMQMDDNQRDYYLREQLKAITDELGDKEGVKAEAAEYMQKLADVNMPKESGEKVRKEIDKLSKIPQGSPEGAVLRNYLDCVLELPWSCKSKERYDLNKAETILNADHYGLEKVKERVLEYLAVRKLTKGAHGPILCLVGPPGVGKTSIAKSVAEALNRKYIRISLGGVRDEADIRGHRKTYIGSMPGRVMNAMRLAGTSNPLILLDELDKMSSDFRGDPSAAMLEVLDAEQNFAFRDHYIEIPFDLSNVLFLTTANTTDTIPAALLDRMEVIRISGYTQEEKLNIAKRYLIPKQLKRNGLALKEIVIEDDAVEDIINYYTRESGVRNLERQIANLCRKMAKDAVSDKKRSITITPITLLKYLGNKLYRYEKANENDEIGIVRGLAWTSVGGDTLSIEVNVMSGTGKLELTGKLGEVMQESAKTAISYIRSKAELLGIKPDFYKKTDIHIHVPEGAVPKDGPSAGITMATALVSALSEVPVRSSVAMTGEITLRGRVLPIGGLKEKSLAAFRAGIKTVIIPEQNKRDLDDIPDNIKQGINFITASDMDTVLFVALSSDSAKDHRLSMNTDIVLHEQPQVSNQAPLS